MRFVTIKELKEIYENERYRTTEQKLTPAEIKEQREFINAERTKLMTENAEYKRTLAQMSTAQRNAQVDQQTAVRKAVIDAQGEADASSTQAQGQRDVQYMRGQQQRATDITLGDEQTQTANEEFRTKLYGLTAPNKGDWLDPSQTTEVVLDNYFNESKDAYVNAHQGHNVRIGNLPRQQRPIYKDVANQDYKDHLAINAQEYLNDQSVSANVRQERQRVFDEKFEQRVLNDQPDIHMTGAEYQASINRQEESQEILDNINDARQGRGQQRYKIEYADWTGRRDNRSAGAYYEELNKQYGDPNLERQIAQLDFQYEQVGKPVLTEFGQVAQAYQLADKMNDGLFTRLIGFKDPTKAAYYYVQNPDVLKMVKEQGPSMKAIMAGDYQDAGMYEQSIGGVRKFLADEINNVSQEEREGREDPVKMGSMRFRFGINQFNRQLRKADQQALQYDLTGPGYIAPYSQQKGVNLQPQGQPQLPIRPVVPGQALKKVDDASNREGTENAEAAQRLGSDAANQEILGGKPKNEVDGGSNQQPTQDPPLNLDDYEEVEDKPSEGFKELAPETNQATKDMMDDQSRPAIHYDLVSQKDAEIDSNGNLLKPAEYVYTDGHSKIIQRGGPFRDNTLSHAQFLEDREKNPENYTTFGVDFEENTSNENTGGGTGNKKPPGPKQRFDPNQFRQNQLRQTVTGR